MNGWKWRSCSPHKKKQTLVLFFMHCMLQELVRRQSQSHPKTPLAFQEDIPCPIHQKCGTQNRTRFVDISKLAWSLGDSVCDSLIGLHAYTCYDTVIAFASRGKLSSLKVMKMDVTYHETYSHVGQTWDVQHSYLRRYNYSLVV